MACRYTGHAANADAPLLPIKCRINTHTPLVERAPPAGTPPAAPVPRPAQHRPVQCFFMQRRHCGETTYAASTRMCARNAADAPQRRAAQVAKGGDDGSAPRFRATTTAQAERPAALLVDPDPSPPQFYSCARQLERRDDDARRDVFIPPTRAGAAHLQRTVDIMRGREQRAELQPPPTRFHCVARAKAATPGAAAAACERLRFTHLSPASTAQADYHAPLSRLPVLGSASASSFDGTAASRLMADAASARDLCAGTAKGAGALCIPGYMGHVPANAATLHRLRGSADPLRRHSKCPLSAAADEAAAAAAAVAAHRSGKSGAQRSQGVQAPFASAAERAMNRIEFGRRNAVRSFFSAGAGEADATLADQFCVKYRPGGGAMKVGAPATWGWDRGGGGGS